MTAIKCSSCDIKGLRSGLQVKAAAWLFPACHQGSRSIVHCPFYLCQGCLVVTAMPHSVWLQACLPVKWLDRGYNLKPTHDFKSAFMIVDHDETDEALARLPIGNIFAPGILTSCGYASFSWPSCPWILPGANRCISCLPSRLTTQSHPLASAMEAVAKFW